jgi:hypothetical protein
MEAVFMVAVTRKLAPLRKTLDKPLTEEQAREIYRQGEAAVVFSLLTLSERLAAAQPNAPTPTTPSGMTPPYQKPAKSSGRKQPGRKAGHPGSRRPPPDHIDRQESHRLACCPICSGPLNRCTATRKRFTEDIPEGIKPVVVEHTIHRDWCPHCRKMVEPVVPDALPHAALGNRTLAMTSWLHYGLGNSLAQIVDVFNFHFQMKLTPGGLVQAWQRMQAVFYPWYEQIQREALASAVLHADETSWRVGGKTHWLWCFANDALTYYMIDRSRGEPALRKFFIEEFQGTLVTDFWGAYNAVVCAARQGCLVHLLRDLETVDHYKKGGENWPAFAKKLRRLIGDAIQLWRKKSETSEATYASRRELLHERLREMLETDWKDSQAGRLVKRLKRHRNDVFTFLERDGVPFENNLAERAVRPAVLIRKTSYCNRSRQGADAQAVLMSVYRTIEQRNHDPLHTLSNALRTYLTTGILPDLPTLLPHLA